jgi:hypothetical protein
VPAKGKDSVHFNGASAAFIANRQKSFDFTAFYAARAPFAGIDNSQFVTFSSVFHSSSCDSFDSSRVWRWRFAPAILLCYARSTE